MRTRDGARLEEAAALDALSRARVVLLGERHDSASDHAWQARVVAGLAERACAAGLAVGFEMFPRRAQPALDDWSRGALDFEAFLEATRWREVWGFDPALYRPLFEFCRDRSLPAVALNVDRPLVSLIGRDGWAALPESERGWLSPAAPAPAGYRRYLFEVTGGPRPDRAARAPDDPAFDRFVRSQGVWDRAFACAVVDHLAGHPGRRLAGIVGRGHVEYGWGTPAQLRDLGLHDLVTALPDERAAGPRAAADYFWTGGGVPGGLDLAQ